MTGGRRKGEGEGEGEGESDGTPGRSLRARDELGRARNSRPRDGLGRPLPYGSTGVARIPDDLVLPPVASLAEAQRLLDAGLPFHAHEILEGTWKAAPPAERDLWQGLAQLAVGLTHVLRGNPAGATTLLNRARARIAGYADQPPYGVDVDGLTAWTTQVLAAVATGRTETQLEPPRLVRAAPESTPGSAPDTPSPATRAQPGR